MKLETITLPEGSTLFDSYRNKDSFVRSFYAFNPWDQESVTRRVQYLDGKNKGASRERLVEVLRAYHDPELLHPEVSRNLERLRQPKSLVVIGGQQAGLLSGPLYTIHKAITLIQWARLAEKRLNRPVIPVFWIAGEDHDRDEVDHVWIMGPKQKPHKHRLPARERTKRPVSELILTPEDLHPWLDELARMLPDLEYKNEWLNQMKEWTAEPLSWTRFFARVMHHFFGKWGLLLVDSADPGLRRLEVPFFRELIRKSDRIQTSVLKKTAEMEEWGFPSPVDLRENQGNLFLQIDGERDLLLRDGTEWRTRDYGVRFSEKELLELVEREPERFSNNVITRPLMQEYLFPTLFFVGGPGEIAYWGLLKDAFLEMGLEMPIIVPREQITIIDRMAEKRIKGFSLHFSELLHGLSEKREKWLKEKEPPDLKRHFAQVKEQIRASYDRLIDALDREIGMNMKEIGRKNEAKVMEQVDYYYHFAKRAIEEKYGCALRRWDELIHSVNPEGKPQERLYNVVQFWNQFGLGWIDSLVQTQLVQGEKGNRHHFVVL